MKMRKEQCKKILRFICFNLDENIHSKRCASIKKHMEECSDCTAFLESLKKTVAFYRNYPVPAISKKEKKEILKKAQSTFLIS